MSATRSRIGWFLVWAVVFCDIGTSVYYVPGILYGTSKDLAGFFVVLTLAAFVLLCVKYLDVTRRFREGGGVVTVAEHAFGPWWGCLGGQLIMVDYFLTAAISATSALHYIDSVVPHHLLTNWIVTLSLVALLLLGILNVVGIKESATASAVLAVAAIVIDAVVIGLTLVKAPPEVLARIPEQFAAAKNLTPGAALVGFSGAWLAFSGLESISQLSPAMRDTGPTPSRGMLAVAVTVILTAPVLTFLSTATLDAATKAHEAEHFISELGGHWGGLPLKLAVVLTASSLLLFAANTAIIGNYHVQIALVRSGFLPKAAGRLSRKFGTPVRAIALSVFVPIVVIVLVKGDVNALGDLYAFGLLGAFLLTSAGLDLIHWREGRRGPALALGLLTTALVAIAFLTNLVEKRSATIFGSLVTAIGLGVAWCQRNGVFERLAARVPRLAAPMEIVHARDAVPYKLPEEVAKEGLAPAPGILVALRGVNEKLFAEAAARAATRGEKRVFVMYVDEVPGLFYPESAEPTPEGLTVLKAGIDGLKAHGLEPVPLWSLGKSAAEQVAEAAALLQVHVILIGLSQRGILWTALRGRFVTDLLSQLPSSIRLVAVG